MVIGNFNCVLKGEERSYGDGVSTSFVEWFDHDGPIDLGFSSQVFTWQHETSVKTIRAAHLDMPMCDVEWKRTFPAATIRHLAHGYSDHCPLLLHLQATKEPCSGNIPFCFQAAWMLHRGFHEWLEEECTWGGVFEYGTKEALDKIGSVK